MIEINDAPPQAGQGGAPTRRPAMTDDALLRRYSRPVPRYTSYPTAPHFAPLGAAAYREWLAALPAGAISLYLHVPFCRALCLFCGCHTRVVREPQPVAAYAADLEAEIGLLAQAIGRRLTVRHLHWGGGTPTILGPAGFAATMAAVARHFNVAEEAEIAVEIDPRTLSGEMTGALADCGVNRASLGVQDFDPAVQLAVNRVQPFATVAAAVARLRRAGIAAVNFDLMYGLPHQSEEGAAASAAQALSLAPDRLAVFGYAHVPWMKRHQALLPEAALPDAQARFRQQQRVAAVLSEAGYVAIGLDHFALARDPLAAAAAAGRLRRNFQGYTSDPAPVLLGVGASAIGALCDAYVQNEAAVPRWRQAVRAGHLPVARGIRLTAEDRLRRDIIAEIMCHLAVDLAATAARHAAPPAPLVTPGLAHLAADGLIEWDGSRLQVTEKGRPFLRTVASAFDAYYRPQPDSPRYSQGV
jgi:oxygen-independent coproporphyrinogen III oxidase